LKAKVALFRAVGLGMILLCATLATSCAGKSMGSSATAGAIEEIRRQKSDDPSTQITRIAAERAVEGALDTVDEPERREQMQELATLIASAAADAAVRDFARRMVTELGPEGEGPLATSLTGTGERISAAVVGSARAELAGMFPGCAGPDPFDCIEKRVERMTRSAGAGFAAGMRDSLGWPFLILAAFLGFLAGILGHWVWSLRLHNQRVLRTT
jgi:hypothetical protein